MIHFIRHGDTLKSIAKDINLENPSYLKEFHNQNCLREDYIFENLVAGNKLFLPDALTVQKYNAKNDAPFKSLERNPKINFNPENLHSQYKVEVTESAFHDGKQTKSTFSYQFSLQWIESEWGDHIFRFSKSNFSNRNETKMEELAMGCMQSISPIEIATNQKGEIIRINLLKETREKFSEIKENLFDQFPDEYAKIYIEEFEFVVLNEELFHKKMSEDWAIKTYFANIRNDFKNGTSQLKMILENEVSILDINQTVDVSEPEDVLVINQISPSQEATFTGKYTVLKDSGIVKSLEILHAYSQYGILYSTDFKLNMMI
ncbi:hypothetical protein CHRY9390_00591 [Chryseobacterium aquaeductus]|uniref:LysM domain-containing protein n=1 Tax=Chryseobacterium aquaeductus TaxID=2675056 RepID=A0A9N8MEZ5_9FLAO|nr:hypothetical protein [Chryseobacterium aquaeductus]CAA7329942.1 hypothetical protein CHRY9390_00591 [Chryseobacterium potabilaquae]CAD7800166.1 hypothetical protein CHRY9390_00591 [Chryseobacterium aquaeductus]